MAKSAPNPYLDARKEWMERYGSYIARARQWRLACMCALAVAGVCGAGLAVLAGQRKVVPYVVAVGELGEAVAVGRADRAAAADERVVRSTLARWIRNARTIYPDPRAQRDMVDQAYAFIDRRSEAYAQLNDFFRANNPFDGPPRAVEIISMLPAGGGVWRAEWREIPDPGAGPPEEYIATVSIALSPPSTDEAVIANPLGVFVTYFQWGDRL